MPPRDVITPFLGVPASAPSRSLAFFFSSRRRHTRSIGDWSSDVCSSDLDIGEHPQDAVAVRQLAQKSRNDLIHVDAFPTRPTNGNRILRVFSNISPDIPRVWVTTEIGRASCRERA